MDRGTWEAAVHGVAKSHTQLSMHTLYVSLFIYLLLSGEARKNENHSHMHWRRKRQPTPVFLPGESQGQGSLVGCRLWGHTESDTTEVT